VLKKFFFNESLIIFLIIGVLTALVTITYIDYSLNVKKNSSLKNHINVVNFITESFIKCKNGEEFFLLQKATTSKENLCSLIMQSNELTIRSAFINHFNALERCNTYGLKNSLGNCMPAVVERNDIDNGNLGETLLLFSKNSLIVHTKISTIKNITNKIIIK